MLWFLFLYASLAIYLGATGRTWAPMIYLACSFVGTIMFTRSSANEYKDRVASLAPSNKDPTGVGLFLGSAASLFVEKVFRVLIASFVIATFGTPRVFPKETISNLSMYLVPYALSPIGFFYLGRQY